MLLLAFASSFHKLSYRSYQIYRNKGLTAGDLGNLYQPADLAEIPPRTSSAVRLIETSLTVGNQK